MKSTHKLTQSAILLAIFSVILLVTLYVPVLGTVINFFLPLPFILYSGKYDRKSSLVFFIAAILLSMIIGSLLAIPLTIAYGLTGLVMGDFIRERKSRVSMFIASSLVFLITLVAQYAVSVAFFKVNFIKETIDVFKKSYMQSIELMQSIGQSPNEQMIKQFESAFKMIETLTPSLFVMASFTMVFLIQLVSLPILKRLGLEIVGWKAFKDWKLPKSLLWYYLLTIVLSMIFRPEQGTYWFSAITNISFILQFFMIIQGLSFVYFYSHLKGFNKSIPVVITILLFFMPILLYIVRILGIIDLGFDLRNRVVKK